jgi:hypothetical protein
MYTAVPNTTILKTAVILTYKSRYKTVRPTNRPGYSAVKATNRPEY